jgi:hypothetical protein
MGGLFEKATMQRKDWDDLEQGEKGDFYFLKEDTYITIRWGEGNKETPTITPSIRLLGGENRPDLWHGWLTNGKLVTA